MKTKNSNGLVHSVLALGISVAPMAYSVERPSNLDDETPRLSRENLAAREAESIPEKKVAVIEVRPEGEIAVAGEEVPYLGIGSIPISDILAGHLGLDHGVVVQRVHAGSGADQAGLKQDDILVTFNDHEIASPFDLRDAVRTCKVGDQVTVNIIRKGQVEEHQVTLAERPVGLPRFAPGGNEQGMRGMQQIWPGSNQPGLNLPDNAVDQLEALRGIIDQQFNDVGLGLKMNDILDGNMPDGDEPMNVELGAQSSVTWADSDGDITMKMSNGDTQVTVRDRQGSIVHKGSWNTDEDKAAVEPAIRDRIENMGVSRQGNQLKFWMGRPGGR